MAHPTPEEIDRVLGRLTETLGRDGWRIKTSRRGVKARWRWLSVSLKRRDKDDPDRPWRARLRDGFPRVTVAEHWADEPLSALDLVIARAREAALFADGQCGLVANPSKGWLGHRLWQAVRPIET